MRILFLSWMTCLLLGSGLARAAFQPIPPNANTNTILDALDARGIDMKDFSADVSVTSVDQATGDSSSQTGNLLFQKLPPDDGRIRVNFTQRTEGDRIIQEHHEYTLAGGLLTERDEEKKIETRRQVVRPGQKIDLLKLGEGPFPLPIGQKKEDVLKQFDVTLPAPDKSDPAGTVHLKLIPKPATDLARRFSQVDIWVDRELGMPTKILTLDATGQQAVTTLLTNLHLNAGLNDADFTLPPATGFQITEEPYHG